MTPLDTQVSSILNCSADAVTQLEAALVKITHFQDLEYTSNSKLQELVNATTHARFVVIAIRAKCAYQDLNTGLSRDLLNENLLKLEWDLKLITRLAKKEVSLFPACLKLSQLFRPRNVKKLPEALADLTRSREIFLLKLNQCQCRKRCGSSASSGKSSCPSAPEHVPQVDNLCTEELMIMITLIDSIHLLYHSTECYGTKHSNFPDLVPNASEAYKHVKPALERNSDSFSQNFIKYLETVNRVFNEIEELSLKEPTRLKASHLTNYRNRKIMKSSRETLDAFLLVLIQECGKHKEGRKMRRAFTEDVHESLDQANKLNITPDPPSGHIMINNGETYAAGRVGVPNAMSLIPIRQPELSDNNNTISPDKSNIKSTSTEQSDSSTNNDAAVAASTSDAAVQSDSRERTRPTINGRGAPAGIVSAIGNDNTTNTHNRHLVNSNNDTVQANLNLHISFSNYYINLGQHGE